MDVAGGTDSHGPPILNGTEELSVLLTSLSEETVDGLLKRDGSHSSNRVLSLQRA